MANQLTLMAVHAHPDDEAIGTGGILARAAAEGIKTVLVTCTGGEVGEIAPDTGATLENLGEIRRRELQEAAEILKVTHLEMLGYRDSGMMGTADNEHPDSFHKADLNAAILRVVSLVRKYRPSVIVTYDENGFYGHPDHINAHRVAVGAYYRAGDAGLEDGQEPFSPSKLYYTAIAKSQFKEFGRRLRELGIDGPGGRRLDEVELEGDAVQADIDMPWGLPDELVTTAIDVSAYASQKRKALWAHATQMGPEVFFAKLPEPVFEQMFGREQFRLMQSRVAISLPETDLFAGLR
jgi:N-acetyl-1-D-myo-inositol-2-amino-2-deoxy-alpha-D-glucopyranoside deacetylase